MTVRCIECKEWRPRESDRAMVAAGFAICNLRRIGGATTQSGTFNRECDRFDRADQVAVDARLAYANRPTKKELTT